MRTELESKVPSLSVSFVATLMMVAAPAIAVIESFAATAIAQHAQLSTGSGKPAREEDRLADAEEFPCYRFRKHLEVPLRARSCSEQGILCDIDD